MRGEVAKLNRQKMSQKGYFAAPIRSKISQKVTGTIVSIVGARRVAPDIGHAQRAPTTQGAQKLRSEAHLPVRRNDLPC
jgi:hypothetical protein